MRKVTGFSFSLDRSCRIYENLGRLTLEERRQNPSLQAGREDVIVYGAAVLIKAAELLGFQKLYLPAPGICSSTAGLVIAVDEGVLNSL
jgi:exopolyphosphatase/pppGpp-phosphohydrolase